ncbi:hypothetical protein C360_05835 [Cryptococcus neoformans Bt15]|nr:hypothetical protein C360_05835 [Cryptococcus neoformans var. grubii Bt15]
MPSHWKGKASPSKPLTANGLSSAIKETPATPTPRKAPATTTTPRRTPAAPAPGKKAAATPNNTSATPKEPKKKKKKKNFCMVGKILQNHQEAIHEEVLRSLIINLKVPNSILNLRLSQMEVFFPAHTIGCIGTEMWRHGMMNDSDAFFGSVLHMIQDCVYSYDGLEAIIPQLFWLSNSQEMFSFVSLVEKGKPHNNCLDWKIRISILRHDLDSLVYNLYQSFIQKIKRHLALMVIPAIIEAQPLPGFVTEDKSAWLITGFMNLTLGTESSQGRMYTTTDIIDLFDNLWNHFEVFFVELVIVKYVFFELLYLINQVAFNDLVRRIDFCSFKRGLQIQYNVQLLEGQQL